MGINKHATATINTIAPDSIDGGAEVVDEDVKLKYMGKEEMMMATSDNVVHSDVPVIIVVATSLQEDAQVAVTKKVRFCEATTNEYHSLPPLEPNELNERWYNYRDYQNFASHSLFTVKSARLRTEAEGQTSSMWDLMVDFCRSPREDDGWDSWDPASQEKTDKDHYHPVAALIQESLAQYYCENDTYGLESSLLQWWTTTSNANLKNSLPFSSSSSTAWPGKQAQQCQAIWKSIRRFDQIMGKSSSSQSTALVEFIRQGSRQLSQPARRLARITAISLAQSLLLGL